MVNDPVGDFIIRIQNAGMAGKETLAVPYSRLKASIAEKLVSVGYLKSAEVRGKKTKMHLDIALSPKKGGARAVRGVKRISKPGRRIYRSVSEIAPVKHGTGHLILSTPKGILTDSEAKRSRVGGEALFAIW